MSDFLTKIETNLAFHRICVDLAHIVSTVASVDIADVQCPSVQVTMHNRQTGVVGQHSVVHG